MREASGEVTSMKIQVGRCLGSAAFLVWVALAGVPSARSALGEGYLWDHLSSDLLRNIADKHQG